MSIDVDREIRIIEVRIEISRSTDSLKSLSARQTDGWLNGRTNGRMDPGIGLGSRSQRLTQNHDSIL